MSFFAKNAPATRAEISPMWNIRENPYVLDLTLVWKSWDNSRSRSLILFPNTTSALDTGTHYQYFSNPWCWYITCWWYCYRPPAMPESTRTVRPTGRAAPMWSCVAWSQPPSSDTTSPPSTSTPTAGSPATSTRYRYQHLRPLFKTSDIIKHYSLFPVL